MKGSNLVRVQTEQQDMLELHDAKFDSIMGRIDELQPRNEDIAEELERLKEQDRTIGV